MTSALSHVSSGLASYLYRTAERRASWDAAEVAAELGADPVDVEAAIGCLEELGLLRPSSHDPAGYLVVNREMALFRLLDLERSIAGRFQHELARCREGLSTLLRDFTPGERFDGGVRVEHLRSPAELGAYLDHRAGLVKRRELVIHADAPEQETLARDTGVLSRGVTLRILYPAEVAARDRVREHCRELLRHGADIRVGGYLPLRMVVMDDDLALLPIDPHDASYGSVAVHSIEIVKAMSSVFTYHWSAAAPIAEAAEGSGESLSHQERVIIRMLAVGAKDEMIARRLRVSSRTLSRAIGTLLDRLGVETRFQAAVKVTKMGLLALDE
ncbi:helix-turn-helix transcriptional regulator [Nonomuraea sp. NBC_01738]|uniref:helix-turn-helix transcriptional regulator n=1 Tax=Nonomuraea sp. NBC_01738 TaxID=2976003 RepID=UPI002E158441|nr:helix-turn-helix transcriptional regulator [Nonomuraea sp. NBC_01738]